ncbi:MAG: septum formation initiator family protein [Magnetococcales bacterium]|nr:septum formation initiator family protein [Magnetococcales bacterium]MBF0261868.1 septum formation initiator family protein [Magnetococcales bacterium]
MSEGTSKGVLIGLALLVANAWAQYLLWFGEQGLIRWRHTEKELVAVRMEVGEVENRIHELKEEIRLLEKDPSAVEGVARRDLGLVYPDEIIFILPN